MKGKGHKNNSAANWLQITKHALVTPLTNEVVLRWARLLLRWVTVCRWISLAISVYNQPLRSTVQLNRL